MEWEDRGELIVRLFFEKRQVTDPEAIKRSRIKSPECVARLSTPSHVTRFVTLPPSPSSLPTLTFFSKPNQCSINKQRFG